MPSITPVEPGSLVVLVSGGPFHTRTVECEACDGEVEIEYVEESNEFSEGSHDVIVDRECPHCHCDIYAVSSR